MGLNLPPIFSNSTMHQQILGLARILGQGFCIDTMWVAAEKVIKKVFGACPDISQLLALFWSEFTYQWSLLFSQTGLQVAKIYFSWVVIPFIVAMFKKRFVLLMANRGDVNLSLDPNAKKAFEMGVDSTRYWSVFFKSLLMPSAWAPSFYQGVTEGKKLGFKRKFDFSISALCF